MLLALVTTGCGNTGGIIYTLDDLNGSYIAVLNNSVGNEDFEEIFPESDMVHFKSSSEFLLALAIGKCDAGIAEKEDGRHLLGGSNDYEALAFSQLESDTTLVIVHRSLLPGRNQTTDNDDLLEQSFNRIYSSLISDGYWSLILKGFISTIVMYLCGIIIAFILAIMMIWMNSRKSLRLVSRPLTYFIRTIHDVPSVVLIFFFYYVVFASVHVSGVLICSIALGVYTAGSLINVFTVHLKQVDRNQHAAAEMLGLTGWNKYRYVILPQAVKPMLPLIGAESKSLLRATTFAGYISELDLVKVTEIIRNQTYDVLVPLLLVSVVFLILSHLIVESLSVIYNKAFRYD